MNELQIEMGLWKIDVEREAAELIRQGTPPYDAIERAKNAISRRRRDARHVSTCDEFLNLFPQ
jgi:hypothetical protein